MEKKVYLINASDCVFNKDGTLDKVNAPWTEVTYNGGDICSLNKLTEEEEFTG